MDPPVLLRQGRMGLLLVSPLLGLLLMASLWTPGFPSLRELFALVATNMDYTLLEITHISGKHHHHPPPKLLMHKDIKYFGPSLFQFVSENLNKQKQYFDLIFSLLLAQCCVSILFKIDSLSSKADKISAVLNVLLKVFGDIRSSITHVE